MARKMIRSVTSLLSFMFGMAIPAAACAGGNVPLVPFNSPIRFTPATPQVVPSDHPLAGKVRVDPISNMPNSVGGFLNVFVSAKELNGALGQSLAVAGMRASDERYAPFQLTVTWLEFDSPFKISFSSRATASLRYELRRVDSGAVIFQRDVTTSAQASGGNATDRQRGTARAALAANLAGAIRCLDLAAYGQAPANCAVSPTGSFAAPIAVVVPRWSRAR